MNDHKLANLIRDARYQVLSDSEAWSAMVQALEFVGRALADEELKNKNGLSWFKDPILDKISEYCNRVGDDRSIREAKVEFERIVELRNDAVHNGAQARNLAHTCLVFGCKLEEAIMGESKTISGVMVSNPVVVSEDDPVALARRLMVVNSFTSIPVLMKSGKWKVLSDSSIARFKSDNVKNRGQQMFKSISEAFYNDKEFSEANTIESSAPLDQIWELIGSGIVLVLEDGRLVGVVTAFDLL